MLVPLVAENEELSYSMGPKARASSELGLSGQCSVCLVYPQGKIWLYWTPEMQQMGSSRVYVLERFFFYIVFLLVYFLKN